ncbi:hypothetical protein C0J52_06716 [Blattella germanica]|nr:hypothetical protein C0J52_06716 [Blattella germanica]
MSTETDDVIMLSSDSSHPPSPNNEPQIIVDCDNGADSDSTEAYFPVNIKNSSLSKDFGASSSGHRKKSRPEILEDGKETDSESSVTLEDLPPVNLLGNGYETRKLRLNELQSKVHEISDSDDDAMQTTGFNSKLKDVKVSSDKISLVSQIEKNVSSKVSRKRKSNNEFECERERKKEERLLKQTEKAHNKALKQATTEALRCKKPEECIKFIRVCLDQNLLVGEYGGQILVSLQAAEMQYNIQTNPVPFSIVWTRETREHFVDDDMQMHVKSSVKEEDEVMIIWNWDKVIKLVHSGELTREIQMLQNNRPGKIFTLVVYGAETKQYFKYKKTAKNREFRAQVSNESRTKMTKKDTNFEKMPQVSRVEWEEALTELQFFGCHHSIMHNPEALGTYIRQFTKAIAEAPFKREKQEETNQKMEWFGEGDSRDTVKVDKNGNGFLRLWQQQLCQFDLVSLETAQAIASVYKSPRALVEAYENCSSQQEGQLLLAKIPVRRGVGPLTTVKTVGPVLSKKIYSFFTDLDGGAEVIDE